MLVNSRTIELTRAFYEWELRGRGWARYPHPVALEPAFRPFQGHEVRSERRVDDARRHTWLSQLAEQFRGGAREEIVEVAAPVEEPDPERDPWPESEEPELEEFVVALPEEASAPSAVLLGWLRSLATTSERVSFEIVASDHRVELRLAMGSHDVPQVVGQLRASVPEAIVLEAPTTLQDHWDLTGPKFAVVEFGLACEFMIPLARIGPKEEPLLPIVAALAKLKEDELGVFQVLFQETRHPWAESISRAVVTPGGQPFFADAPEITSLASDKISSALFAVAVRIGAAASHADRAFEIVAQTAGGLSQFGSPKMNELMPLPTDDHSILERDLLERRTHRSGMLLSVEELVSLVQLPGPKVKVPELFRALEKTKQAPAEATRGGCFLGVNEHLAEQVEVCLDPDTKMKHIHVLGGSGMGKSTLLVRMILDDIEAGHGVGVLDPHGDLIDEVAGRVPDSRIDDVVLFDPSDSETVVGFNILGAQSEVEKDLLASDLVGVFRRLSTSWGDQMTTVLANAILVFLESKRGGTLSDLRRFLIDESYRKEMLGTLRDPHVASFWETEFPLLIGRRPQAPILTRLDTFLRSKLVRQVVTVRDPKLDFREVTDKGRIFLGKLAMGAIGEENAALLGSLLVSKFHQVTIARAGQAVEERRPFFLYIDEFHHVATASMAALFSGVRKYRLGLTVAHQDLHQLHRSLPEVERSILANAHTRICFRLGDDDARQMERGFSYFTSEDLMSLGLGDVICRVGGRDKDFDLRTERLAEVDAGEVRMRRASIRDRSRELWGFPVEGDREDAPSPGSPSKDPKDGDDQEPSAREVAPSDPAPKGPRSGGSEARPEKEADSSSDSLPQLSKAELDYLELVADEPFLSVRERNDHLGASAWKGQEIKKSLIDQGLVREVAVNPGGRGKRFQLLELTSPGRTLLSEFGLSPSTGHGRGGVAHQWWVTRIVSWLEGFGFHPKIEDESTGARVDVLVSARRRAVAVEVEMTDGHVLENIRKDLAAGVDLVVSLLDDPASLERLEKQILSEFREDLPHVHMGPLWDFEELLASILDARRSLSLDSSGSLRRPNQNREPKARRQSRTARLPSGPLWNLDQGVLSTPFAADYVGLSPDTLETYRYRGGGPKFSKLGRRVVYRREDLDAWLEERSRQSTQ